MQVVLTLFICSVVNLELICICSSVLKHWVDFLLISLFSAQRMISLMLTFNPLLENCFCLWLCLRKTLRRSKVRITSAASINVFGLKEGCVPFNSKAYSKYFQYNCLCYSLLVFSLIPMTYFKNTFKRICDGIQQLFGVPLKAQSPPFPLRQSFGSESLGFLLAVESSSLSYYQ